MTVIVTRKPCGVTQLFNTETGKITYKCKAEFAQNISNLYQKEIQELENKLSSL